MTTLLFFFLAFLWGGSFIAIKIVVALVPPLWAASSRLIAAFIFLATYNGISRKSLWIPKSLLPRVWICGLCSQGIPFIFLFWGEQTISPGLAGILNGTVVVWTFILGLLFIRKQEPFTTQKFVGLILGLAGIVVIFAPKISLGLHNSSTLGALSVGVMGFSYGIGNIINKSIMVHKNHPTLDASLFHQTTASAIFVTFVALLIDGTPKIDWLSHPHFIWSTLYMGIMSTGLAFIIYYRLINTWGAVRASSVVYLVPMSSVFLDWLFNGNIPSGVDAIGIAVILSGILMIQNRGLKLKPAA